MCGITGIFDTVGEREVDRSLLKRMNDSQTHRGPDGDGTHFEPGVGLGHRRLAIIDLKSGQQPLYNEDGTVVVVFNGEIYNFPELTIRLKSFGHTFRTHSDTEVIVHAWEQWGSACVEHFNGMFAFAIWDRHQRILFLARDRLGVKPLLYSLLPDGTLLFGSELKALLLHPDVSREIDPRAIEQYLAFGYVPDPRTILHAVQKLGPGHTLTIRRGAPPASPQRYWNVSFAPHAPRPEADIAAELAERLREAVKLRLISEVPLGAFLSGGVDSSAVVAMMAGLSDKAVRTCSIAFSDPQYDEAQYAARVASLLKTDHHVERVESEDFDLLDTLVDVYDEPFADSSAIPTYRVCELARKRVTVALSGDGGDENFGGYRRYRMHAAEDRLRRLIPDWIRRQLVVPLGEWYPKLDWAPRFVRAKSTLQGLGRDPVNAYFHAVSLLPSAARSALYSESFRRELQGYDALEVFRAHAATAPTDDPLSLIQYLDYQTYLPGDILTKVDRASMAHSLEVREPVLDYTLVDWTSGVDPQLKLRRGEGKHIFKQAMRPYLPHDILYRTKMGFAVPMARWIRGPLRERLQRSMQSGYLVECGIFDPVMLEKLTHAHVSGRRDYSGMLWALLMFDGCLRRLAGEGRRMASAA
jgi:asparagine synthase (glutamine-hydrolysing)